MTQAATSQEGSTVWVTRAEPGAAATAQRLTALGFAPVVAPLLAVRPIAATLNLRRDDALAFTSLAGVLRTCELTTERGFDVFAVGDATAEAARAAGFKRVYSAAGDVEALAGLILKSQRAKRIVHPGAEETAGDLVGRLRESGREALTVPLYRTEAETALAPCVYARLEAGALSAVLIHSPKAGRLAAGLLMERPSLARGVTLIGLSAACTAPLRDLPFSRSLFAPSPTENDLLAALLEAIPR